MMKNYISTVLDYTPIQLKFQLPFNKIIEVSDPIYSFNELLNKIDLSKYFVSNKYNAGRPRFDCVKLLKIILFAFMENGYASLRNIEKLCKTDIRFMWLLDGDAPPSFMTIANFMNDYLLDSIDNIFKDINSLIFSKDNVDLHHIYIDGTKLQANANKYSWVWKKSCLTNRNNIFKRLTNLITEINQTDLIYSSVRIGIRTEYSIEYLLNVKRQYIKLCNIDISSFVKGSGKRKSLIQKHYELLSQYIKRLKAYAKSINICGNNRNSYSKTDNDATFMRIKRDYMGNDQLLPAYNLQLGICDEYIVVADIQQYASDTDCFIPLMDKFNNTYGFYPTYPVADAGYGSFNNYLYCEQKGMEKFMKFSMFEKETKDEKYHNSPYRAVNFKRNEQGNLVCPNNKEFHYLYSTPIKGNNYGRTEEYYRCEDCENCNHKQDCHKGTGNRVVRINKELTSFHLEVINNLNSIQGALLRMNRSIQAEGTFGIIKQDRGYSRIRRKGLKSVIFELLTVCCGFNLYKYHLKRLKTLKKVA